jgi:lysophospholipase L1-like esterase
MSMTTGKRYDVDFARFDASDKRAPPAPGRVVIVGSSSIRRWEGAAEALAPWGSVQRGFGGGLLTDVAVHADTLVTRHRPSAVVVFAGSNDVTAPSEPAKIVNGFRCLVQKIRAVDGEVPVFFVAITPTPLRWHLLDRGEAVNAGIRAVVARDPSLHYVDVASPFLARSPAPGEPPDAMLFVDDRLHLSDAGYALWSSRILDALDANVPRRDPPTSGWTGAGVVSVTLGGVDATNRWPLPAPGGLVLAGEALGPLRDGAGAATPVRLVVTGGFRVGGAAAPSTAGAFIASTPDEPAGLRLEGLAPGMDYDVTITVVTAPGSLGGVGQVKVIDASPPRFAEIAPSTPSALVMLPATADRWGAVTLDFQPPEGDGLAISQLAITGR